MIYAEEVRLKTMIALESMLIKVSFFETMYWNVNIFLVFLSSSLIASSFQLTIPAEFLMTEIARKLIALMAFLQLRDDFNINFNRLEYSFLC